MVYLGVAFPPPTQRGDRQRQIPRARFEELLRIRTFDLLEAVLMFPGKRQTAPGNRPRLILIVAIVKQFSSPPPPCRHNFLLRVIDPFNVDHTQKTHVLELQHSCYPRKGKNLDFGRR